MKNDVFFFDFAHRRFREVLAAAYIDTPRKHLELLTHGQSIGLSEFMRVFRRSEQWQNMSFHYDTLKEALSSCQGEKSSFYVLASDAFVSEKPLGLDVSSLLEEFLVRVLTAEAPYFRLSNRLLLLCPDTPPIRNAVESCLERAKESQNGRLALLAWRVMAHLNSHQQGPVLRWTNALRGFELNPSTAAACLSFSTDLDLTFPERLFAALVTRNHINRKWFLC
jgi:hypothetical protein